MFELRIRDLTKKYCLKSPRHFRSIKMMLYQGNWDKQQGLNKYDKRAC